MAYSKFTNLDEVLRRFKVKARSAALFPAVSPVAPSAHLLQTLERSQHLRFSSEKERSERLVHPVLQEVCVLNQYQITLYSGRELNVDPKNGLSGECDYLLSRGTLIDLVDAPLFSVVEAKKNDLEYGIAQCAAQMIGAQRYNKSREQESPVIYGASTTGTEWRFMQLQGQELLIDDTRYYLVKLDELMGVLQRIVESSQPINQ